MPRSLATLCVLALLTASNSPGRPADEKKSDGEVTVAEGTEFKLSKDEITVGQPTEEGRAPAIVKAAAAPAAVKMKAQKWTIGLYPAAKKDRVEVAGVVEDGPLQQMRTRAKGADEAGGWMADPGDVITHVNGYAVKTVEELICAVHAAEDEKSIQLVIKDVGDGKQYVFYVTAVKK